MYCYYFIIITIVAKPSRLAKLKELVQLLSTDKQVSSIQINVIIFN